MKRWRGAMAVALMMSAAQWTALAQGDAPAPGGEPRRAGWGGGGRGGGWAAGMPEERMQDTRDALLARLVEDPRIKEELGLSDEQVAKLKADSLALKKELVQLRADLELAAMEQAELMKAEKVDEEALMAAVEKTGEIRTKIAKSIMAQVILTKKALTPEQIEKIKTGLRDRMQSRREARGGDGEGAAAGRGRKGEGRKPGREAENGGEKAPPAPEDE